MIPKASKYVPHPYFCYALQPGRQRDGANHNSRGFRGPEFAVPKPTGVIRVAVLGVGGLLRVHRRRQLHLSRANGAGVAG